MIKTNKIQTKSRLQGLYVITDHALTPADKIEKSVQQAINGGCTIVQYRDKTSSKIQRLQQATKLNNLCRKHDVMFIINDDLDLAKQTGAHGVHLGKDDADLSQARNILGRSSIIGISCYNDLQLAITAEKYGADYVAFGSIFDSAIKPDATKSGLDILLQARQHLSIPIAAIGGINPANAADVINAGADMLAVISSVFAQKDITRAANEFDLLFNNRQ